MRWPAIACTSTSRSHARTPPRSRCTPAPASSRSACAAATTNTRPTTRCCCVPRSARPWYDSVAVPAQFSARVSDNRGLGGGYVVLEMQGDASLGDVVAGQFVMLRGEWGRELLNPRAFSVLWSKSDRFAVLLKAYGRGT